MPSRWIVLSFDGLATAALGPYGSSWNETPAINQMAAFGTVWDRCIANSDDSIEVLRAIWQSRCVTDDEVALADPLLASTTNWIERCREFGKIELFIESGPLAPRLKELANDLDLSQCTVVETIPCDLTGVSPAIDIEATAFAGLLAPVIQRVGDPQVEAQDWSVLWIHSDWLTRCWDAPRELFPVDEEDLGDDAPEDQLEWSLDDFEKSSSVSAESRFPSIAPKPPGIFDAITPPVLKRSDDDHPDLVTSWMQTYGCQVRLIDHLIGWLLESVLPEDGSVGLAVIGTSGFSLGQNGWIGFHAGPIRSPQIHLPIIAWNGKPRGLRLGALTQPADVTRYLMPSTDKSSDSPVSCPDWLASDSGKTRQVSTSSNQAERLITTDQWFLAQEAGQTHLFLKPDDREDVNDIADRCRDVVETLCSQTTPESQNPTLSPR